MLGDSVSGLGKLGYGIFYVVPASYLYILLTDSLVDVPYLSSEQVWWLAIGLLFLSIYAAIWIQRVGILIYGNRAGVRSTKPNEVRNKHLTFFATGVAPARLPETSSLIELVTTAFSSDGMKWGVFLRYIPAALFQVYTFLAWIWLSLLFFNGVGDLVVGALWLTLTVVLFRSRVIGYLPHYIPPESVSGFDEAEYVRNRRQASSEIGRKNQRRIEPRQQNEHKRIR